MTKTIIHSTVGAMIASLLLVAFFLPLPAAAQNLDAQREALLNQLLSIIGNMGSTETTVEMGVGGTGTSNTTKDNVSLTVSATSPASALKVQVKVAKPCSAILAAEGLYRVDFGDGSVSASFGVCESKTFTHAYKAAGTYTIKVESRGNLIGAAWQTVTSKTVNVSSSGAVTTPGTAGTPGTTVKDNVSFTVTPITGAAPLKVQVKVSKPCSAILAAEGLYRVDYGNGTVSASFGVCEAKTFTPTYNTIGNFTVTLQSRGNLPNATWQTVATRTVNIAKTGGKPAPTCSVTASKTTVASGEKFTIKWTSQNATSISGRGVRSKQFSGSLTTSQTKAGLYTHTIKVSGNGPDSSCAVSVGVKETPPKISYFRVNNNTSSGHSFEWAATGASHCVIASDYGGSANLPAKGLTTLVPNGTGEPNYELRCYSSAKATAAMSSKRGYLGR